MNLVMSSDSNGTTPWGNFSLKLFQNQVLRMKNKVICRPQEAVSMS